MELIRGQTSIQDANLAAARWWLLAGLWLTYTSFGFVAASIAPMVAPIEAGLGLTHAAMGSIMGAWQLVYIFSAVPCGLLLDRIGGRRALLIGILLIAASGLGRAVAVDYWTFLLAVMLFGLGGPIISSGAPKLVAALFTGSQRGMAMGIYMTGPAVGGVVCLGLTNSWLLPALGGWRQVMLLWTGAALVAAAIWWVLGRRFPIEPDETSSRPAPIVAPRGGSSQLALMAELWRTPPVRLVLFMGVGIFLFNHGLNGWLVEMLRVGGMEASTAGYWATVPTIVGIVGSLLIPRWAVGERRFAILAALCILALAASILLRFTESAPLTAGLILQGVAKSSLMTVLVLTLVELPEVGDRRAGAATGLFFSAAEVGGVLGPLGMGVLYDLSGGFHSSLTALTAVACLLLAGSFGLRRAVQKDGATG